MDEGFHYESFALWIFHVKSWYLLEFHHVLYKVKIFELHLQVKQYLLHFYDVTNII